MAVWYFDSSLIIVPTNIPPDNMARACSTDNEDAMYRRFTDTCGAYLIDTKIKARNNLIEHLVKIIAKNVSHMYNVEIDV